MAIETKAWLKSLGFSDEKIAELAPIFDDGTIRPNLEKQVLMQSDYSRSMDELRGLRTQYDEANARLTTEMAEWAQMTQAEKAAAGDLRTKLNESEQRILTLEQKLTGLAEESGIDPKTVIPARTAATVVPPTVVPPTVPGLDRKEIDAYVGRTVGTVADYLMTLNVELPEIAREHFELTGQRLDTRAFVAAIKADLGKNKTDNLDPRARWEAEHNISALRSARDTKARNAEITAAREEGRMAALSEQALPNNSSRTGSHGPIFGNPNVAQSKLPEGQGRPQPSQRLSGAVAALATGKYRTPQPATP